MQVSDNKKYIFVNDFGAVGDGIHDDTQAILDAVEYAGTYAEQKMRLQICFASTPKGFYKITGIDIPSTFTVGTWQGFGECRIKHTDETPFRIESDELTISDIQFEYIGEKKTSEYQTSDSYVFKDNRKHDRLDFDLTLNNCKFTNYPNIVYARGRGVHIIDCSLNMISNRILVCEFPSRSQVWVPHETGHASYYNGIRGFFIERCRLHYCEARIIEVLNDPEKVMQGVSIQNNFIEGGATYFKGACKNLIIKDNLHIHAYETRGALVITDRLTDATLDFQVTGYDNRDGSTRSVPTLLSAFGTVSSVRVQGRARNVTDGIVYLQGNAYNYVQDLIIDDWRNSNRNWIGCLILDGFTYRNIYVGGSYYPNVQPSQGFINVCNVNNNNGANLAHYNFANALVGNVNHRKTNYIQDNGSGINP